MADVSTYLNFNGTTELFINRGNEYQAINPTGPLQKTLQAEIATIRSDAGFFAFTAGTLMFPL